MAIIFQQSNILYAVYLHISRYCEQISENSFDCCKYFQMSKLWYLQKQFILTLKEDSQPDAWQPMLPDRRHPIKTLITVTLKFSIGAPSTRKNVKLFFLFSLIAPNHGLPLIFLLVIALTKSISKLLFYALFFRASSVAK